MDSYLEAVTAANHGIFSRGEALAGGWTDRELAAAVRDGKIHRLRHGAYCPRQTYVDADARARHLLVARAALARQRGRVALTGVSAAALRGYALHDQDLSTVQLVRLDAGSARCATGTTHHRLGTDLGAEVEELDGCLVVSPARTVWEVAVSSSLESGVCTADSALRRHPTLAVELRAIAHTFDQRPGSRRARIVLHLADGAAESPGESLSRVLFFRAGVPCPQLQHEVRDPDGRLLGVADFSWPEHRHLGEFDGRVKYGSLLKPGEAPGDAVFREKRREDLMRSTGVGMTRWTWSDLMPNNAPAFLHRLRTDLERSRLTYARAV